MHINRIIALLLLAGTLYGGTARHVVAVGGKASGNAADSANGWSWRWAVNDLTNVTLQAGDTLYLHAGQYNVQNGGGGAADTNKINASGTAENPLIIRNWNNQRAHTYSDNSSHPIIINGSYVWVWGLEISQTDNTGPWDDGGCVQVIGDWNKIINCIIHDAQGISVRDQTGPNGTEVYGNILSYSGRQTNRNKNDGYHFYTQNTTPYQQKLYKDNIFFASWGQAAQIYGTSAASVENIAWIGNFSFNHGNLRNDNTATEWGSQKFWPHLILGPAETGAKAYKDTLKHNILWSSQGTTSYPYSELGYHGDQPTDCAFDSNYFCSPSGLSAIVAGYGWTEWGTGMSFKGNVVTGGVPSFVTSTYGTGSPWYNTYYSGLSTGRSLEVKIRKNDYEPKRANIAILNWSGASTVQIDPSSVLADGDTFRIVSATNFYGPVVLSGVYSTGGLLTISMSPSVITMAVPIGGPASEWWGRQNDPLNPVPYFAALVLMGDNADTSAITPEDPIIETTVNPTVLGPIYDGATSVSGLCDEIAETTILVYINSVAHGTITSVVPGGTWVQTGLTLAAGDSVKATAHATGKLISAYSNTVVVIANSPSSTTYILKR